MEKMVSKTQDTKQRLHYMWSKKADYCSATSEEVNLNFSLYKGSYTKVIFFIIIIFQLHFILIVHFRHCTN